MKQIYYPFRGEYIDWTQVPGIKDWCLENFTHTRLVNKNHDSYELKHICEKDFGQYVSNETFIMAMQVAGFKAEPEDKLGVNFYFKAKLCVT
jgi:hypothetical protein